MIRREMTRFHLNSKLVYVLYSALSEIKAQKLSLGRNTFAPIRFKYVPLSANMYL